MKRSLFFLFLPVLITACTSGTSFTAAEGVSIVGESRRFTLAESLGNERQDAVDALRFFDQREAVVRFREVSPNRRVFDVDGFRPGDVLFIELFSGSTMDAIVEGVDVNVNGTVSIRALLPEGQGYAIVTSAHRRSLATLLMPGHEMFYRIISDPVSFRHFLIEMRSDDRDILEGEVAYPEERR